MRQNEICSNNFKDSGASLRQLERLTGIGNGVIRWLWVTRHWPVPLFFFSIRNSHTIILFNANYEISSKDAELQLQRSMIILHKCYKDDQRRSFHAKVYADQALRYFWKYHDEQAIAYLSQAQVWLTDELANNGWDYEIRPLLKRVTETLVHKEAWEKNKEHPSFPWQSHKDHAWLHIFPSFK